MAEDVVEVAVLEADTAMQQLAYLGHAFGVDVSMVEADYQRHRSSFLAEPMLSSLRALESVLEAALGLLDAEANALLRLEGQLAPAEEVCGRLRHIVADGRLVCGRATKPSIAPAETAAAGIATCLLDSAAADMAGLAIVDGTDVRLAPPPWQLVAELEALHRENAALRMQLLGSTDGVVTDLQEPEELRRAFRELHGDMDDRDGVRSRTAETEPDAAAELRAHCALSLRELDAWAPGLRTLATSTEDGSLERVTLQTMGHLAQLLHLGATPRETAVALQPTRGEPDARVLLQRG